METVQFLETLILNRKNVTNTFLHLHVTIISQNWLLSARHHKCHIVRNSKL